MTLDVGGAVGKTFRFYFRLFGLLYPVALAINAVLAFAFAGIDLDRGDLSQAFAVVIVAVIASMIGASLVTAVSTLAAEDMQDGERRLSFSQLLSGAMPVLGSVIGVSLLAAIGVAIGIVALVIPGIIALVWWSAAVPSAVIERTGVVGAFTRSVQLVKGKAWGVFGYGLVMVVVLMVVDLVLSEFIGPPVVELIGAFAADIALGSVTTPFVAVGYAVLYFELRRLETASPVSEDPWTGEV